MKILVTRRMKGYAYADGQVFDMPDDQAELFLQKEYGVLADEEEKSSDYTISQLRDMDLSDKDDSFFEGDDRSSIDQIR